MNISKTVRFGLTLIAATIGVIVQVIPHMPEWADALITGLTITLAAFGIVPPHLTTNPTVVHTGPVKPSA